MISNRTLAKVAVYVGVAGISSVMYMRSKIEERIRNTDYFRLALGALRRNKGAVNLLGEPIKDMGFDISDSEHNQCDGQTAQFEVAVKGSKNRGTLYFWATRNNETGWLLDRLELEIKTEPDKRFILKNSMNQDSSATALSQQ
uniref:Cytochrome oxidase complex assembly protein 1 n=1 Tax=Glossina brevipalpis TaxID=37001 RepID=A0A1A9WHV7_9MUSC